LGRDDVLRLLLDRGGDANSTDARGRTAWVAARAGGAAETAALLEQYGATPDVNAALLHAAAAGNAGAGGEPLPAGAAPNTTGTLGGESVGCLEVVLGGAAAAGADPFDDEAGQQWVRCAEALLAAGLDVDRTTAAGRPLLIEAVAHDRPEILALLIGR